MALTRSRLDSGSDALLHAMRALVAADRARWQQLAAKIDALSPLNILERGYALVFDAGGNLVKDATQLQPGEKISARVARGSFTAEVKQTKSN
jgi:exodeoxyribonuclease VII large subunit